jgi:hypothetical protein
VPGAAVAATEAAVSGFVDPNETSETGAALAGSASVPADAGPSQSPSWERLDPSLDQTGPQHLHP